jgi:hypothetical protein
MKSARGIFIVIALLLIALPDAGYTAASEDADDLVECTTTGALAGTVVEAVAAGEYTLEQFRGEVAKARGQRARRLKFVLARIEIGRGVGETNPLLYAANTAAVCMAEW